MPHVCYPQLRQQLISLDEEDQSEVRAHFQSLERAASQADKDWLNEELARHCQQRARTMLTSIQRVTPTVENIGMDGSQAVIVLTLHSYLSIMETVLTIYEARYADDPASIYAAGIPPLRDRIMILKERQQSFGTNWAQDRNGKFYLIPVFDFATMNERRAQYGLGPAKRPVILSHGAPSKHPLGQGLAQAGDQHSMSNQDYHEYAKYYLKELV